MFHHFREHEIVAGLQAGSSQAWSALYQQYSEKVWRRVTRLVGDKPADVADLVQDIFLSAAQTAGQYDAARGNLWQWIWGITHNKIAAYFRRKSRGAVEMSRLSAESSEAVLDWLDQRVKEPPEVLQTAELIVQIRLVLVTLPAEQADLLIAKYVAGASMQEIADQRELTLDAATSRLARARAAFRKVFESGVPAVQVASE